MNKIVEAQRCSINEILVNDLTGWVCPKCGKVLSPLISVCPCGMRNPDASENQYENIEAVRIDAKPLNS